MHKERSIAEINKMSPEKRWMLAKDKLSKFEDEGKSTGLVGSLLNHLREHENTRWLVYNRQLSSQVSRSNSRRAFASLQRMALHYEIIRLCSFWDPIDLDSRSLPTIVKLTDDHRVSKLVHEDHSSQYQKSDQEWARRYAERARRRLRDAVRDVKAIEGSQMLRNVRNYRNKLAHQLEQTNLERNQAIPKPRFGDERKLLGKTVTNVNRLYLSLSGVSFDWMGSKNMARRDVEAFWKGVSINVLR